MINRNAITYVQQLIQIKGSRCICAKMKFNPVVGWQLTTRVNTKICSVVGLQIYAHSSLLFLFWCLLPFSIIVHTLDFHSLSIHASGHYFFQNVIELWQFQSPRECIKCSKIDNDCLFWQSMTRLQKSFGKFLHSSFSELLSHEISSTYHIKSVWLINEWAIRPAMLSENPYISHSVDHNQMQFVFWQQPSSYIVGEQILVTVEYIRYLSSTQHKRARN